ncbi:MAG TPA: hypothetical protein VIX84_10230 [Acidimicrobiales bacterium]
MAVLLLVPLLAFVVPALFGAPALSGDNLIQNFPLRAFSGQLLRHGHLPLWNQFAWSGSPLLGGMNAGSFFPLTFLFVVLPPVSAWVLNMTAVYWVAGLGTYWLLRQYGVRPLAGFLGAAVYAYGGAMVGQMVHLGIIQGMALMPVIVLAILKISWAVFGVGPATRTRSNDDGLEPPVADPKESGVPASPWPWVVALAVLVGLIMLTGEPRSIAETEIVAVVMALWLALRGYGGVAMGWGRRARFAGAIVLAGAWGVAIGAAQLLPGYNFINLSQRANEPYSFFASGSLHTQWTVLLLVPDLFGGSGTLHQPTYFNSYNLPEVTGYVGLLPLVACAALLTRSFGRNRDRAAADWAPWLFLALLGLVLAWGQFTPLGGLFGHIWIFGRTRLQSRSLGIVDLALAVLFAFWADRALGQGRRWLGTAGWRRWISAAPAMAAVVVCIVAIAFQRQLESAFGAFGSGAGMTPWFVAQLLVALAVVALVLGWRHLRADRARWALSAVVVVDLALFGLSSATGFASATPDVVQPSKSAAANVLGTEGRFAMYYPLYPSSQYIQLGAVGQPDLNVFTTLPSVQGYGSIVDNTYGTATDSHTLDTLDPCALARGAFTPLRLHTLLTSPSELAFAAPSRGVPSAPAPCPGVPPPGTAEERTWYFGRALTVSGASLATPGRSASTALAGSKVGVLRAGGAVVFPSVSTRAAGDNAAVAFRSPVLAVGLVVRGNPRAVSDTSEVTTVGGPRYVLAGGLQDALGQPGWAFTGTWAGNARFEQATVRPPVWLQSGPAGATATQIGIDDNGTEVDRVTTSAPALMVRSESNLPGWHATAVPTTGGASRPLPIRAVGLIQGVQLPAGSWTVTFRYHAPGLDLGLAGSAVGIGAVLVVVGLRAGRRRRVRRS